MGDFANITLNGKPLADFLLDQNRREIERHIASQEAELRRNLARGRSVAVPLAASKRGRKPTEIRAWVVAEIKALAADPTLMIDEIAVRAGQPASLVRLCFRQEGIKRKRGRKKSVRQTRQESAAIPQASLEGICMNDCGSEPGRKRPSGADAEPSESATEETK